MISSFWRNLLFGKSSRIRVGRARSHRRVFAGRTFRPFLEVLEDRTVLSTLTVLNANDSGADSLRQAILDANAAPGADTIVFNPAAFATPKTISLGSQLSVTDDLTILGPGAKNLTVSGNSASRV